MEHKKLSDTSELRDFWKCYDILESTQRYYGHQIYDIYGGPDKYKRSILSGKLIVSYTQTEVGRILGAISYELDYLNRHAHIGYLHIILQGRGLGTDLLNTTIQELQTKKISTISLRCGIHLRAYEFYLKHGFNDTTKLKNHVRHMERKI